LKTAKFVKLRRRKREENVKKKKGIMKMKRKEEEKQETSELHGCYCVIFTRHFQGNAIKHKLSTS
jgi:hypothetical protein